MFPTSFRCHASARRKRRQRERRFPLRVVRQAAPHLLPAVGPAPERRGERDLRVPPRAEGVAWHQWSPPMIILQYTQPDQTYDTATILYPNAMKTGTYTAPR